MRLPIATVLPSLDGKRLWQVVCVLCVRLGKEKTTNRVKTWVWHTNESASGCPTAAFIRKLKPRQRKTFRQQH